MSLVRLRIGQADVQVRALVDGSLALVALRVDVLLDEALGRAEHQNLARLLVAQIPGQAGRAVALPDVEVGDVLAVDPAAMVEH